MSAHATARGQSGALAARSGFSIVELLVAITLTLSVFAITLPFVRAQSRALGANAGRLDAEQVARYAQRAIDSDLRLATVDGVGQPLIVQADSMAISFNVNLLAPDTSDPNALAVEAGAAATLTESWRLANAAALPRVAKVYPTVDYLTSAGTVSRNETVSYFLRPDTVSGRSDVYVLYRRVNARDSVQVVRGLHVAASTAFFTYFRRLNDTLAPITTGLPLYFDNVASQQIRAVGIRSSGFFRNRQEGVDVIRTVDWRTTLASSATTAIGSCGAAPAAPTSVNPSDETSGGLYRVELEWDKSTDEVSGAADVRAYEVLVRPNSNPVIWQQVATVPATGISSYRYHHILPQITGSVKYGVRAIDCGGLGSTIATHNANQTLP